jgi:rhodanese-related sulfurtransferase
MVKRYSYTLWALPIISVGVVYYVYQMFRRTEITPQEAKKNLRNGAYDYVVDVRTEKEWSEDHLPYAISIPIGSLVTELPKKIPNRSARILFVCKKGIRASAVVVIANKLGYKNVQSMTGNFKELID